MAGHSARGLLLVLLVAAFGGPACAQSADAFRSPSGNIFCQAIETENGPFLRCDIRQISNRPPPRPRSCDLDYGQAFEISAKGDRGVRLCYGDTVANEGFAALAYGATWQRYGFTCTSATSGVRCVNARGHGFELSRAEQKVF